MIVRPILSIIDDTIVIVVLVWVLSLLGIKTPWWLIGLLALVLLSWSLLVYRATLKNPTGGFENMVGQSGMAVENIHNKGTVRIGNELWQANSDELIEKGDKVEVTGQSGLKLTVVKKA